VLTAHPNLKALAGTNDDVGLGIVKAVQQQGKLGKVATAGHGGSCNGLASILQGQLGFTVLIPGHAVGAAAVDVAYKLLQKQSVDTAPQYIPAVGVDSALAKGILDGSQQNPPGIDVKAQLTAAQAGCQ
jgi:ABC-type sugar transport system substrate-binding protein